MPGPQDGCSRRTCSRARRCSCARARRASPAAGAPPGVLNVVNGDKEAVNAILDHPDISAVSFVGSTPVAKHVYSRGSLSGKRVQALGGAKNHMVIMPDADLDQAVDALMGAAYGSAGERCMAISVAVAVGDIGDKLIDKCIITYFKAPFSFTGEHVLEINCHGGNLIPQLIIESLVFLGAKNASPGEFSYRAFLNNKIDLIQAESISSLISSKNDLNHDIALKNLSGFFSKTERFSSI